jgi:hypothetical protein
MKSQQIEILLKDLLHITTRESYRLSEILAENFDFFKDQIVRILREEYEKPKNDWRIVCGCFSVIWQASQKHSRIGDKIFQNSYPLINKGLLDRRDSVKRLAVESALNIICKIYLEKILPIKEDNNKEIKREIRELKKNIKSVVFLEAFNLIFPKQLEKRIACESAGIKEEFLIEASESVLG